MKYFCLTIISVLINWKSSTATTSTKEIYAPERNDVIAKSEKFEEISDGANSFSNASRKMGISKSPWAYSSNDLTDNSEIFDASSSLNSTSRVGKSYGSYGTYGSYGYGDSSEIFDVTVVKQLECPYSYTEVDGLCLSYVPCSSTDYEYNVVRSICQSLGPGGGDLVTFKDANEYHSIVMFLLQNDPGYGCDYWLGASKDDPAWFNFVFVDGTSLPNTGPFWYTGEPDTGTTHVAFFNELFYRLADSPSGTGPAGAICQYRPGNVTLTQRIYPQRPPQIIPIPYPVEKGRNRGGHGGVINGSVTNLDLTLPASNFSSEQNANFQNAPVINIETHSHFIDSSPDIIPIPSYPLPPNGTSYGSPPYLYPYQPNGTSYGSPPYPYSYYPNGTSYTSFPQPGYPYNTYVPQFPVYNNLYPNGPNTILPGPYNPVRAINPVTVNRLQPILNSGHLMGNMVNVPNQIMPSKIVPRVDSLKAAAAQNRTINQKITKGSTIVSKPKKHPQIINSIHVERVDGFKQRSRENVPQLNMMVPPPIINEKENKEQKKSEDIATQLTFLLDMIDTKYGDPSSNPLITADQVTHPTPTVSKAEETANMIKIMNELQAMIAKIEQMEIAFKANANQGSPYLPPDRQKQKTPLPGGRRMQGSRLLDI